MKTYSYDFNAANEDYTPESCKQEILAAIKAWKEAGKPNSPNCEEGLFIPYETEDGKLSFESYCYEGAMEDFEKFKAAAEELPEVREFDLDLLEEEDNYPGMVYGDFYVHTNIDFETGEIVND